MAFQRVCALDEIGDDGLTAVFLDWEVLVVRDGTGRIHAMDGTCPHEDFPLVYGFFDGSVLTCSNHLWSFDATTGRGINPPSCKLNKYAVKIDDGVVYVDTDAAPDDV
jgi:toluene monooxygenase system ferredoxin subunit